MNDPRLVYIPREDATPEGELAALAAIYAFILKCHEQKKSAEEVGDKGTTEFRHAEAPREKHPAKEGSV